MLFYFLKCCCCLFCSKSNNVKITGILFLVFPETESLEISFFFCKFLFHKKINIVLDIFRIMDLAGTIIIFSVDLICQLFS